MVLVPGVMLADRSFQRLLLMRTGSRASGEPEPSSSCRGSTWASPDAVRHGLLEPISDMAGSIRPRRCSLRTSITPINVKILVLWWILLVVWPVWVLQKTKVGKLDLRVSGGDAAAAPGRRCPGERVKIGSL